MGDEKEPVNERVLQFEPFTSCIDAGFWSIATRRKLTEFGLDDAPKSVLGSYSIGGAADLPCMMDLDGSSLAGAISTPPRTVFPISGCVTFHNTVEKFRDSDKQQLVNEEAEKLWALITSGKALDDPALLTNFSLFCYMDLKKYLYHYWFLFPALVYPDALVHKTEPRSIHQVFSENDVAEIVRYFESKPADQNAFLALRDSGGRLKMELLRKLPEIVVSYQEVTLCICDASVRADNPGWTARNILALFAYNVRAKVDFHRINVLCFRQRFRDGQQDVSHSVVFDLRFVFTPNQVSEMPSCPKGVGWERNKDRKLGPRSVDLSGQMDPKKLAEQAVGLNLQLMRWRLVPELNLELLAATKCLILGSGTLGCSVARCLLGWGVTNITFVDNARVSYSNPVRQSLFSFEDCLDGGKPKSQAAADEMRRIYPSVNVAAHQMSIPMPGHSVPASTRAAVLETVNKLETLIDEHDVVFLLMDTRESRWLPTLIGASKRKIVMNAALGYDSFLVMRHGLRPEGEVSGERHLGCYFCNDVVAPGNSTRDRTLDQQCTVTRPGISMLASAHVVELLVTVLQHPQGAEAMADATDRDGNSTGEIVSPLGIVPHQIRGFLSRQLTVLPSTTAFDKCTACSDIVVREYERRAHEFLLETFNNGPSFLEDLTGLTALHKESEQVEVWNLSDDESLPGSE